MLLINNAWCSNSTVYEKGCYPDVEYLTLKCRPYYLPREYTSCFITAVYAHPRAGHCNVIEYLRKVINTYDNDNPDCISIVCEDFNDVDLRVYIPNYHQSVTCPTRGNRILDKCYCNIKNAFISKSKCGFGKIDHDTIFLTPIHKTRYFKKEKNNNYEKWSEGLETLNDCLESTDWNIFASESLNQKTEVVNYYVNFCVGMCIPERHILLKENKNKPWLTA